MYKEIRIFMQIWNREDFKCLFLLFYNGFASLQMSGNGTIIFSSLKLIIGCKSNAQT